MGEKTYSWTIAAQDAKTRLDQFLLRSLPDESRSQIQNWIRQEHALVNRAPVKTGYRVKTGDSIALCVPAPPPPQPFPEDIPLVALYEDDDVVVINKPAGMACHAGAGLRAGTLVNALLFRLGPLEAGDPERPGIVHRLDKFTSGVIVTAKNNLAHRELARQFKAREVRKEYIALVHGAPQPKNGTIDMAIGRDPNNRRKMSTRSRHGRRAVTHYTVRESFGCVSLLDIRIETGRTHQIRVHLAAKGYPIVGDTIYGAGRDKNLPGNIRQLAEAMQRPFLHSSRLEFTHPRSGERMSCAAPLPDELRTLLSALTA